MNYFSSDFHLGHKVIYKYRPQFKSAEEHDEKILSMMEQLKKRDILFILGDFLFDSPMYEIYLERIKKMPVRIKLVMGNHDNIKLYKDCIDSNIEIQLPLFSYKNMWVSHCPIFYGEMRNRIGCIHGHLHLEAINSEKYFNVNIDVNNYEFVKLETIKGYFNQSEINADIQNKITKYNTFKNKNLF